MRSRVLTVIHSTILILLVSALGYITREPMIFPSLGPTALFLAWSYHSEDINREDTKSEFMDVIGGHTIGVISGFIAFSIASPELTISMYESIGHSGFLRIGVSSIVAMFLTTGLMFLLDTIHTPACATTIIVATGILTGLRESIIIIISCLVILVLHEFYVIAYRKYS